MSDKEVREIPGECHDTTTSLYQRRKGYLSSLSKYISRASVMVERSEDTSKVEDLVEKIEFTMFRITKITEEICASITDKENEVERAKEVCTEHLQRANKSLQECKSYIERALAHQVVIDPMRASSIAHSEKSCESIKTSSTASRRAIEEAKLIAIHENAKAQRKLKQLKLKEEQFKLQQKLERSEVEEKLCEVQNKVELAKMMNELENEESCCGDSLNHIYQRKLSLTEPTHQRIFGQRLQSNERPVESCLPEHIITEKNPESPVYPRTPFAKINIKPREENVIHNRHRNTIDGFIDELKEGFETHFDDEETQMSALSFLQAEYESKHLPPIALLRFNGDPSKWPEFIENFSKRVHFKRTFSDNERMERLVNVLDGDAKRVVQSIGHSGIFYPTVMKTLKRDFGNPTVVSYLKLKSLFDLPQLNSNNKTLIRNYQQCLKSTVIWLSSMGYNSALKSMENITKAVKRLPNFLRNQFYKDFKDIHIDNSCIDLIVFGEWLEEKIREMSNPIACIISNEERTTSPCIKISKKENFKENIRTFVTNSIDSNVKDNKRDVFSCWLCSGKHKISDCEKFANVSVEERRSLVKTRQLCYNCLSNNHKVDTCRSRHHCKYRNCVKRHHTLLHHQNTNEEIEDASVNNHSAKQENNHTYLQIVPISIPNGDETIMTNAILDTGSDSTLIREDIVNKLKLKGSIRNLTISNAISDSCSFPSKKVNFDIKSQDKTNLERIKDAWVVKNLNIHYKQIDRKLVEQYEHLNDINFPTLNEGDVTLLIGCDHPELLVNFNFRKGQTGEPIAIETKLGWVLMGGGKNNNVSQCNLLSNKEMSGNLENFWKIDSYATHPTLDDHLLSPDQQHALKLLKSTTKFNNGHYEVGMLWKPNEVKLPNNRQLALKRLISLEKKFERNSNFEDMYRKQIKEYIKNGYAKQLSNQEISTQLARTNYIPHHGVLNINKPNKVRVVFDAAAKYQNTSLNDNLVPGIDFLNKLVTVLCRFRLGKYAVMADIEAMFHQVKVSKQDMDSLRFLWRDNPTDEISEYVMGVHIFGKIDSPCIANWALRQSALQYETQIKDIIYENFYMDDLLYSHNCKHTLNNLCIRLKGILSKHGFNLTKWISNDRGILRNVPPNDLSSKYINLDLHNTIKERALGMTWDINNDSLTFTKSTKTYPNTKRGILSKLASIFDPLGILNPYILEAKLILQELWKINSDWDDEIAINLKNRFHTWEEELNVIERVQLPRWLGSNVQGNHKFTLEIYADASMSAYGVVSYLRIDGKDASFLLSKSRLCPIKSNTLTIPRLELQAAVIAVRMKETIMSNLKISISETTFYTDSEIVLKYIQNTRKNFPIFVMNRLHEIRLNSKISDWKHIAGNSNPADMCTRYTPLTNLIDNKLWLSGPNLTLINSSQYTNTSDTTEEVLESDINMVISEKEQKSITINWDYFSEYTKLVKCMSWLVKTIRNWINRKRKGNRDTIETLYVTVNDRRLAEAILIRFCQRDSYSKELRLLQQQKELPINSNILPLNPMLKDEVIRVGGRIDKSNLPFESKHQIILDKDHTLTKLIVDDIHKREHHNGRESLLASLRNKYWIPRCRGLLRKIITSCLYCKRCRVNPKFPIMSQLPKDRMDMGKPAFYNTGVDYFGPMLTKQSRKTRSTKGVTKRWGAIFTCLTTRAVHVELVYDLSTDAFILALRRFAARRGHPRKMRSDNGTNFVGAERELKNCLGNLEHSRISKELAVNHTEWLFNPPSSPWMSGAMESMVKLVKRSLKAIVKDRVFTDDSLQTFLTEVESIVNNRPLTNISDSVDDLEALTPNHFVMGRKSNYLGTMYESSNDVSIKTKWRAVEAALNMFWKRWLKEYLPSLTARKKWNYNIRNIRIGDLVLLCDKNVKRANWDLARVTAVHPGNDDIVRVITVRTKNGTYKRPVGSVAPLEFD